MNICLTQTSLSWNHHISARNPACSLFFINNDDMVYIIVTNN